MARSDSFQKKWASVPSQFERPSDALIDRGWAGGAAEDPPEAKWENWWHNRVDEALAEIESNGALAWFEDVSYRVGATARSGGKNWIAAIANTGIEPGGVDDAGHWQELSLEIASQAEAEDWNEATANNVKRMTPLRVLQAIKANTGLAFGYLSGFAMANNASTPNTTINVSAGSARSSDNTVSINLTGTLRGILQASGAWAAGDNQNKLDTGARANNTWYHVFAIRRTSDRAADILFSLSPTAPTMPTGYSGFRRIGSIRTDGSGNIRQFNMTVTASGRRLFSWTTPIMDVSQVTLGTTATLYALSVPSGVIVESKLNTFNYVNNSVVYYSDPATADLAPANSTAYAGFTCGYGAVTDATIDALGAQLSVITNSSSQIRARANVASTTVSILTLGWEE